VMERLDNRYIVSERVVLYESDVLLTPYAENQSIDARLLGAFIQAQYDNAGITSEKIDTGALILTGVAVRRSNARAIGELFAKDAGKFVSVSAGDALETTLAAFGSGAAALSIRLNQTVMNIDIGGGTTKMAVCVAGEVVDLTALDVGARIVAFDQNQQVCRLEEAAKMLAQECGFEIELGQVLAPEKRQGLVALMAHKIIEVAKSKQLSPHTRALLRLDALRHEHAPGILTFSGGVSEYIYSRQSEHFDDLGPQLALEISKALQAQWPEIDVQTPEQGIRATVVGASQYTVQVSGSTIFVEPKGTLPLRNVPVIAPKLSLSEESIDSGAIAKEIKRALKRLDLSDSDNPVALCYKWGGSATFRRLDDFCKGVAKGFEALIAKGHPLMLIGEADCAGLIGIHCQEEIKVGVPVISVDGITLSELDFVDIGALLETSGAVPVVIKSLVFPVSSGLGKTGFQPT
jgi:ethanolamine utilization protein EutA